MSVDFQRIAIVNRGEPAMRFIHAVREYNLEHRTQIQVIALYTEPDRQARFVREADESVFLGDPTFVDRDGARRPAYLDYALMERAFDEARADAVWAGWGFVGERPEFVELCERKGLAFVGADSGAMRRLGDKINAKRLAEQAGVPVVPWGGTPVPSLESALVHAERLGYPVAVKASAGAGGRGIARVDQPSDMAAALAAVRVDATRAFNDSTTYIERWIPEVRHIEVQVQADHHGTVWALGTRDCSVQRRRQKLMSEAPAPGLGSELEASLLDAAVRLVAAGNYRSQVSVEFLVDESGRFYFLEANTRLQVEHVVTELIHGIDLVKLDLHVARGGRLDGQAPTASGHAMEVRLNAEDPLNGFAASPGSVSLFRVATGPGVRVDAGVAEGDTIPTEFGAMFAKLAALGATRDEALGRAMRALSESAIVVSGGPTNRSFLLQALDEPEVRQARVTTTWLDGLMATGTTQAPERFAKVALLDAAIEVYESEFVAEVTAFFETAARMRPTVRAEIGRPVELSYRGHRYELRVLRTAPGRYRLDTGSARLDVEVERLGPNERWVSVDGRRFRVVAASQGYIIQVEVDGVPHAIARADEGLVRATSPAVVVTLNVAVGDVVAAGDRLAVLEAMKMEMSVTAPFAGTVRQVLVLANAQVGNGTPLLHLEPLQTTRRRQAGPRVAMDGSTEPLPRSSSRARALLRGVKVGLRELRRGAQPSLAGVMGGLRAALLGFDVDATDINRLIQDYQRVCQGLSVEDRDLLRAEDDLIRVYVDIRELFGRQRSDDEGGAGQTLGTEQYFLTYLRTLDGRATELPSAFVERLVAALGHYGLAGLDLGPQLRESLLWIFKSQQRVDVQTPILQAILARRLREAAQLAPGSPTFVALVQRLLSAVHGRVTSLVDVARDVLYRFVEQPSFERVRGVIQQEMLGVLGELARAGVADPADPRLVRLVECAQPLRTVLASSLVTQSVAGRLAALEVLVRRDYRIRTLQDVRRCPGTEPPMVIGSYQHAGQRVCVIALCAPVSMLDPALAAIRTAAAECPSDQDVVVELYLWAGEPAGDSDVLGEALSGRLEHADMGRPLRRTVMTIVPGVAAGSSDPLQFFTYRPFGPGYREDRSTRGVHPMVGKRLQLWRLDQFFLERLPAVEEMNLFRAVARENAKDERLMAIAEVRDVTALRDERGMLISVPHLERMAMEGLTAIRRAQLRRAPEERLHWNRLMLHVRPALGLSREEMERIASQIGEQADGLGLEKVVIRGLLPDDSGVPRETVVSVSLGAGRAPVVRFLEPSDEPIRTLSDYDQKVVRMRQRGLVYPYEIVRMLTAPQNLADGEAPSGVFTELDVDASGQLVEVERPHGKNTANIVVGIIRNTTPKYPEGMTRVVLLGDPSREVGSLAEPECRRILGALDLAERLDVPLEWFALSAGAKISMESGTENMDWISQVLRRIIEFTQGGGEINIVVTGINVGGQPYWNAEATMLMHTRGILVMMPESAMVLTGKTALDYSGSVSADDNLGIGGYEHIMGPNGQAQYFGKDLREAVDILMRHYDHCYRVPGELFPRRSVTNDPPTRDIRPFPHGGGIDCFATVGEIFSDEKNGGRKKPFEIRRVMLAVSDQDHQPLERWAGWRDGEIGVTWDAHIGGYPVCLLGFESRPVPRLGLVPPDGPAQYTSGTLFPMASKKIARSVNAASGNRPLVILANLSGFDGSPESMRRRQLEFGAEIGRAVVNFRGPIIFTVVSRYHGGAFVVFSKALNPHLEVAAIEGSFASVIGGAPAAAVVFSREVDGRTKKDPRVIAAVAELKSAPESRRAALRSQLEGLTSRVRSEKLGEVADEFDRIHSVHRALQVGSLDRIIKASELRPYLIDALERGMAKYRASLGQ